MVGSRQVYRRMQNAIDKKLMPALGNVKDAVLRRSSGDDVGDRPCKVVLTQFTPAELMGRLLSAENVKAIISSKSLAIAPDKDKDRLVTFKPGTRVEDKTFRIVQRPVEISPAGTGLVWIMPVRDFSAP